MFKDFLSVVEMEDRKQKELEQARAADVISENKAHLLYLVSESFPGLLDGVKDPVFFYVDNGKGAGTATGEVCLYVGDAPHPFILYHYRASDTWRWGAASFSQEKVDGCIVKVSEHFTVTCSRNVRKWLTTVVQEIFS